MILAVSDNVWLSLIACIVTVAGIAQTILTAYMQLLTKRDLADKCEVIDKTLGQATERREAIAEAIISNQTVARTDASEAKK